MLFKENFSWIPKLDRLCFYNIDQFNANWLERSSEEEEILDVVRRMARDKAPGLDDFT